MVDNTRILTPQIQDSLINKDGTPTIEFHTWMEQVTEQVEGIKAREPVVPGQAYQDAVLADNPTYYYRLEEGAFANGAVINDLSGNSFDASITSGSGLPTDGAVGGALSPDGSMIVRSASFSLTNSKSLEFWMRRPAGSSTSNAYIFSMGNNFEVVLNFAGADLVGVFRSGTPGIPTNEISATVTRDDIWHHVVVVHQGSSLSIYLDGVSVDSASVPEFSPSFSSFAWGATTSGNNNFGGHLDEIAMYNDALSPARILAHFNARSL